MSITPKRKSAAVMFTDIAGDKRKFEMVKGAMSAIGLYKKLYE